MVNKMWKIIKITVIIIGIIWITGNINMVKAMEESTENNGYKIGEELEKYDFAGIDSVLSKEGMDFGNMVQKLATGQSEGVFYELFRAIGIKLFGDLSYNKDAIVKIIFIGIISSLFTSMSLVLKKSEMSETGFYVTYMLLITILTGSFFVISNVVVQALEIIINFMNVLIPAFFLSVGVASGAGTALGFSQLLLLAIGIIEKLILRVILPAVNIYVIILLVNNIVSEDYFSKFADVLKTFIIWALKGFTTVFFGANIIQSMVLPAVDGAKTGIVTKLINIIPGGTAITAVEGIVSGTGNIIKNAIGGAGLVAICILCVIPIGKMLIYTGMYKLTGAIIQPISDKRIGNGIDAVSEGVGLLYKITITVVIMFFMTVAIVCIATNIKG